MAHNATKIFISYGRKDAGDLANRLKDDLMAVGYSVWLDLNQIQGGADWSQQIEDAIEQSDIMLALLSPASYNSQWCRAEQLRATRKGKRLIPLLAITGAEVPLHLEHINYLDFTQANRYDEMFRDLMSDINAGIAFRAPTPTLASYGQGGGMIATASAPYKSSRIKGSYSDEKRTAPAYRRFLRELRQEPWLGARFWWPYFLFHFTDMHALIDALIADELQSPVLQGEDFNTRWDKFVRLYFRPRTPDLFYVEGFRSALSTPVEKYAPIPIYLLFDLEAVILDPNARFADGDPEQTKKTYATPQYFRDMPFEEIYHDSWFMPDQKEEIIRYREAQVLIPKRIGLESLQVIWLRSPAEYETLRQLMPTEIWHKWRDKFTARTDYHLFNNKRTYVQYAALEPDQLRLTFNPCQVDCNPFVATATITYGDGQIITWQQEDFMPQKDLTITLPRQQPYTVQFKLDGNIAYAGQFQPEMSLL
ncbi:MAG: DarT ssDNA thymidine ADP-ribosyltransferase family protein [Phototrophicaceae bacterium]